MVVTARRLPGRATPATPTATTVAGPVVLRDVPSASPTMPQQWMARRMALAGLRSPQRSPQSRLEHQQQQQLEQQQRPPRMLCRLVTYLLHLSHQSSSPIPRQQQQQRRQPQEGHAGSLALSAQVCARASRPLARTPQAYVPGASSIQAIENKSIHACHALVSSAASAPEQRSRHLW